MGTRAFDRRRAQSPPRTVGLALACTSAVLALTGAVGLAPTSAVASRARAAAHFPCSGPNGAHVPCHFSTPSGNIRCLWTPAPDSVACELIATRHGYRLRPRGSRHAIALNLRRRGETLPRGEQIVFPQALSCRGTRTSMTCNQDFGFGHFTL